jgi:hypothetical protein
VREKKGEKSHHVSTVAGLRVKEKKRERALPLSSNGGDRWMPFMLG